MVINFPNELMSQIGDEKVAKIIKFLFGYFETGRHDWFINDQDDMAHFEAEILGSYSSYIKKQVVQKTLYGSAMHENRTIVQVFSSIEELNNLIQDKISVMEGVQFFKYLDGHRYTVILNEIRYELITIDIVLDFLGQPLKIILEDVESDRLFVEKCLELLGENQIGEPWVEFVHGGGSALAKVAKSYNGKCRTFCLLDSDVISPPDTYNTPAKPKTIKNIERICEENGYSLHILNKREMENYLPDRALKKYLEQKNNDFEHIYFTLSSQCKDYFDMKKGLTPRNLDLPIWCTFKEAISQGNEEIAATVTGKKSIVDGFGENVWTAFQYVESAEELLSRDNNDELKKITQKIVQLA
ncbi:hypothetical protein [Bacillus cereus]|uniref:hypothetical protein n=1 Tax=Bacillus cereus TaxID=1396 RepID=UPI0034C661DB